MVYFGPSFQKVFLNFCSIYLCCFSKFVIFYLHVELCLLMVVGGKCQQIFYATYTVYIKISWDIESQQLFVQQTYTLGFSILFLLKKEYVAKFRSTTKNKTN